MRTVNRYVHATGDEAERWLDIGQAFAGPARCRSRANRTISTPIRIGNCSAYYGDRLGAMGDMLNGGALDVLTGDYLAELTMLILGRTRYAIQMADTPRLS